MEAVALLNTTHYSLAEMKAETPVCTLPDFNAKASANTIADGLAEVKAVKVGHAGRGGRPRRLAKHWETEAEALVCTFPDTLSEVVAKLAKLKAEALGDTLADLKAEALFHAVGDTVAVVQAETL